MFSEIFRVLKNAFSNSIITLSGEVIISVEPGCNIGILHTFDRSEYKDVIRKIKNEYSFINVEQNDSLTEINIKFFALNKQFCHDNFLDDFNDDLIKLVTAILKEDTLFVRVNVFGKLNDGTVIKTYRYLNNKDDVRYKITDEDQLSSSDKMMSPKMKSVILLVALLATLGYHGYQYWQGKEVERESAKQKTEQTVPNKDEKKDNTAKDGTVGDINAKKQSGKEKKEPVTGSDKVNKSTDLNQKDEKKQIGISKNAKNSVGESL